MKKYCKTACLFFISILMSQCMKHRVGMSSANHIELEIEYCAFDATNCKAVVTYENDSVNIVLENEELIFDNDNNVNNRIIHIIPVEKHISDTIAKLALELFVSKSIPLYVCYEYDQGLPIIESDAGWITVRNGLQENSIEINDFYTKKRRITSDQHYLFTHSNSRCLCNILNL